jgi:hypothetical protein
MHHATIVVAMCATDCRYMSDQSQYTCCAVLCSAVQGVRTSTLFPELLTLPATVNVSKIYRLCGVETSNLPCRVGVHIAYTCRGSSKQCAQLIHDRVPANYPNATP